MSTTDHRSGALEPGIPYAMSFEGRSPAQALQCALRILVRSGMRDLLVAPYDGTAPGELARQLAGLTLEAYPGVVVVPLLMERPTQESALALTGRLLGELAGTEVRCVTVAAGPAAADLPAALALTGFIDLPGTARANAEAKQVAA